MSQVYLPQAGNTCLPRATLANSGKVRTPDPGLQEAHAAGTWARDLVPLLPSWMNVGKLSDRLSLDFLAYKVDTASLVVSNQ